VSFVCWFYSLGFFQIGGCNKCENICWIWFLVICNMMSFWIALLSNLLLSLKLITVDCKLNILVLFVATITFVCHYFGHLFNQFVLVQVLVQGVSWCIWTITSWARKTLRLKFVIHEWMLNFDWVNLRVYYMWFLWAVI
jgi:hypothetical protein